MNIVAVALEQFMFPDGEDNEKISVAAAPHTRFSFSGDAHAGPVVDSGRDPEVDFAFDSFFSGAAAFGAFLFRNGSGAVADGAGLHDREESLRDADLSAPAAAGTALMFVSFGTSGSFAGLTGVHAGEFDIPVHSENGIFEFDFEFIAQIVAILGSVRIAASSAAEEAAEGVFAVLTAEEAAEDIERIVEALSAAHSVVFEGVFAIAVVEFTFFGISQDFVSLRDLLEFFRRGGIARVSIRMVLDGEFAVGAFDFDLFRGPFHPQDFVIVSHCLDLFFDTERHEVCGAFGEEGGIGNRAAFREESLIEQHFGIFGEFGAVR